MSKVLEYYTQKHRNLNDLRDLIKLHVIPIFDRLNESINIDINKIILLYSLMF